MGPHWFRSILYDCSSGFLLGSSGFCGRISDASRAYETVHAPSGRF
jgi:hypothetical protein